MNPFGNFSLSGINLKRTLFRRDAERSFYSGNGFPLPRFNRLNDSNLQKLKESYPFNFASSKSEFLECSNVFPGLIDKEQVIKQASRLMKGYFDFPSKSEINIGNPVTWNKDYLSGYEWSKNLSWKDDFLNFPLGTDLFNAWLPARLNQLIYLGKGYLVSPEDNYVNEYISLLENFKTQNPFGTGVNWLQLREVSIRQLNLIFSLPFFIHSDIIDYNFLNNLLDYILLHSVFIENNLEYNSQDYDYLIALAALTAAGLIFKENDYGKRLLYLSTSRTENAVRKIISSEGISKARSLPQHPGILEALFITRLSLKKASFKISPVFEERYSKMFDVLASLLRDDGSSAQIGEPFINRILPFSNDEYNFPLAYGCYEFKKGKFKKFITDPTPDILFYFGRNAVQEYKEIPEENYQRISYGYTQSGIYILRNDDIHITVDAEPIASSRRRTAGHNDILSYDLFYKGHKIISDPGMYSVYADPSAREILRSVKSHSTIYIDDLEPVEFDGPYTIREDLTNPKMTEWHSDEYEDILSVQHYAYAKYSDPVIIKRIFRLLKEKNKLIIRSELFGGSTHKAVDNIILHPAVSVQQHDNDLFKISSPINAEILVISPVSILNSTIQENLYSSSYGKLETTKKISTSFTAQFPVYLTTEIQFK